MAVENNDNETTCKITFWPVIIYMLCDGGYSGWRHKQELMSLARYMN